MFDYISNHYGRAWVASRFASRKGVHVPLAFIDINDGNFYDALLFSQIMYWHEPSSETGKPRLSVRHDNHLWLAKNHGDWYKECRIKASTVRKCLDRLKQRNLIYYELHGFDGDKTPYIRVNWETFESLMTQWETQNGIADIDTPATAGQGVCPAVADPLLHEVKPNTENTTETTAEREPKATMQEAADAIYPPSEETNIIPLHVQRFEQQNNSATHPWIKAYCEVRNMPAYRAKQNEMALIVQYAGKYTVDAFKAYAAKRIQERHDIKLYWILQDMPEDLAKAAPAPLPRYRTMSEPDEPPTLSVMSEEDRQHALSLIAARKARMAQESADTTEKAS